MTNVVYRLRDAAGDLLYIGSSGNLHQRMKHHRSQQPWFAEVAHISVEEHPDRISAYKAETAAIHAEHPRYNRNLDRSNNTLEVHDRYSDGVLTARIETWREEGRSFAAIADDLQAEGIDVCGATVRRFFVRRTGDAA